MKKGESTMRAVDAFQPAEELATIISQWMVNHPDVQPYGVSVMGYAFEIILGATFDYKGADYDIASEEFRRFLAGAHNDVKRAEAIIQAMKNLAQA